MTKHAVVGRSLSLRAEATAYRVGVTAVCPGVVDTPLLDEGGPADLPQPALMGHVREIMRHYQPRFYSADRFARDILRGIDRRRAGHRARIRAGGVAPVAVHPVAANWMATRRLTWARARFAGPGDPADTSAAPVPAREGAVRDG